MESELVELAFQMAARNRQKVSGLLHHSDRGTGQYAGGAYQTLIQSHLVIPSMSRKGNCYDNSPMESFFSTLKCELVDWHTYQTRAEARTISSLTSKGFIIVIVFTLLWGIFPLKSLNDGFITCLNLPSILLGEAQK